MERFCTQWSESVPGSLPLLKISLASGGGERKLSPEEMSAGTRSALLVRFPAPQRRKVKRKKERETKNEEKRQPRSLAFSARSARWAKTLLSSRAQAAWRGLLCLSSEPRALQARLESRFFPRGPGSVFPISLDGVCLPLLLSLTVKHLRFRVKYPLYLLCPQVGYRRDCSVSAVPASRL